MTDQNQTPIRIGITERGDASCDYTWIEKLNQVHGAILITKNLTESFIHTVMNLWQSGHNRIIIHATCTGYGLSWIEQNAPYYTQQISQLSKLVSAGFPLDHTVLRIDPIFPNNNGIENALLVIQEMRRYPNLQGIRIRISILDQYPHVRHRFQNRGFQPLNGGSFHAPNAVMERISKALQSTGLVFECCAEPNLTGPHIIHQGCVSDKDLRLLGLPISQNNNTNPQNRRGCQCLCAKTELLTKKHPCPMGCVYCYWKKPGE